MTAKSAVLNSQIGRRVALRRAFLGMSQGELATALGVAEAVVMRLESGAARPSPGRLIELAGFLGVPITFFFEDTKVERLVPQPRSHGRMRNWQHDVSEVELFDLADAFSRIRSQAVRLKVIEMINLMAEAESSDDAMPGVLLKLTRP